MKPVPSGVFYVAVFAIFWTGRCHGLSALGFLGPFPGYLWTGRCPELSALEFLGPFPGCFLFFVSLAILCVSRWRLPMPEVCKLTGKSPSSNLKRLVAPPTLVALPLP